MLCQPIVSSAIDEVSLVHNTGEGAIMIDSVKISVLVVDDHHITRKGLVVTLQQCQRISVAGEAADGRAAVEKSLALRPAVILMDVSMPILDGIDAM